MFARGRRLRLLVCPVCPVLVPSPPLLLLVLPPLALPPPADAPTGASSAGGLGGRAVWHGEQQLHVFRLPAAVNGQAAAPLELDTRDERVVRVLEEYGKSAFCADWWGHTCELCSAQEVNAVLYQVSDAPPPHHALGVRVNVARSLRARMGRVVVVLAISSTMGVTALRLVDLCRGSGTVRLPRSASAYPGGPPDVSRSGQEPTRPAQIQHIPVSSCHIRDIPSVSTGLRQVPSLAPAET
ncbi:hypothetical protein KEM55_008897 [Ascosphaera atra]|nr:hypothetical protein KEM55_008897 [Ascosphaera atra]